MILSEKVGSTISPVTPVTSVSAGKEDLIEVSTSMVEFKSQRIKGWPCLAKVSAMVRPIPDAAPVTTTNPFLAGSSMSVIMFDAILSVLILGLSFSNQRLMGHKYLTIHVVENGHVT